MRPSKQIQTGIATIAAAALVTGCCGTNSERRHAMNHSPAVTTAQFNDNEVSSTRLAAENDGDRTRVRENEASAPARGAAEWSLPLYSENLRVGKREVENGSVRLRKVVRTENSSQPVELRRETVVIDREAFDQARRSADAGQASEFGAQFQEKEIVIDLKREEAVVEVTPQVTGRIIAHKKQQMETQNVQRQVRREEVEVVKSGNEKDIVVSENVRASNGPGTGSSERINVREREGSDTDKSAPDTNETK